MFFKRSIRSLVFVALILNSTTSNSSIFRNIGEFGAGFCVSFPFGFITVPTLGATIIPFAMAHGDPTASKYSFAGVDVGYVAGNLAFLALAKIIVDKIVDKFDLKDKDA